MKLTKRTLVAAFSIAGAACASSEVLVGPFIANSGNWSTVQYGHWENHGTWGGNGASQQWVGGATSIIPDANWLPHRANNNFVWHWYSNGVNGAGSFGAWMQSGSAVPIVQGQTYVISMFINLNGRHSGGPNEHHTFSYRSPGNVYYSTPPPNFGVSGWQFVYTEITPQEPFSFGGDNLFLASLPLGLVPWDKVHFDELAVTPIANFQAPLLYRLPGTYTLSQGLLFGGNVSSFAASDDNKFIILCDESTPNASVEVSSGGIPAGVELRLRVESSATRTDITELVDAYNYSSNSFTNVAGRSTTLVDSEVSANLSQDFVSGSGDVNTRLRYIPQSDLESSDGWSISIDAVSWEQL